MFSIFVRNFGSRKNLTLSSLSSCLKNADYVVRGDIVTKAAEIEHELDLGKKYPFKEVTHFNIGNPQYLGQKPLTWVRQGLSLITYPELLSIPSITSHFPSDIIERASYLLNRVKGGVGAYSESQGLQVVRETITNFIAERDGTTPGNPSDIFMTNGASPSVEVALACTINSSTDGVLVPYPQFPLFNALITLKNGQPIGYFMDEIDNYWKISIKGMQQALDDSRKKGINTIAIVVINPGNPTGHILSEDEMKKIVEFCELNKLVLLADEVYQDNIYNPDKKFHSFRKVINNLKTDTELFSFHSLSKGFAGECGLRGGYVELLNIDPEIKAQLLKLSSIMICCSTIGQLGLELVLNPPKPNQPSYDRFIKEKTEILESLHRKSQLVVKHLNQMKNIKCNHIEGAMYAMPSITFSKRAFEEAEKYGMEVDKFYVTKALEETGIMLLPGSGFGQKPGTYHFRLTILGPENTFENHLKELERFNSKFHRQYS